VPGVGILWRLMQEEWKDVPGYEGLYQASTHGRIRSLDKLVNAAGGRHGKQIKRLRRGRIMALKPVNKTYLKLDLYDSGGKVKTWTVHRLIAITFIPNPNSLPLINHKDENPFNNCINNLEWCTAKYNTNYGQAQQRKVLRINKPVIQYDKNNNTINEFISQAEASRQTGIGNRCINECCTGKRKTAGGYIWRNK